jgi:hypothetical protein
MVAPTLNTSPPTLEEVLAAIDEAMLPDSTHWHRRGEDRGGYACLGTRHGTTEYTTIRCTLCYETSDGLPGPAAIILELDCYDYSHGSDDYVRPLTDGDYTHYAPAQAAQIVREFITRHGQVDAVTPDLFGRVLRRRHGIQEAMLGDRDLSYYLQKATLRYYADLVYPIARYPPISASGTRYDDLDLHAMSAAELWEAMPADSRLATTKADNYRLYVLRICHLVDWLLVEPNKEEGLTFARCDKAYTDAISAHPEVLRFLLSRCIKALYSVWSKVGGSRGYDRSSSPLSDHTPVWCLYDLVEDMYGDRIY